MIVCYIVYSSYVVRHSSNMETRRECCPRNRKQSELSCIYLMGNRKDPEIHTESSIDLLFCGVAGNGVRVCRHVD